MTAFLICTVTCLRTCSARILEGEHAKREKEHRAAEMLAKQQKALDKRVRTACGSADDRDNDVLKVAIMNLNRKCR